MIKTEVIVRDFGSYEIRYELTTEENESEEVPFKQTFRALMRDKRNYSHE